MIERKAGDCNFATEGKKYWSYKMSLVRKHPSIRVLYSKFISESKLSFKTGQVKQATLAEKAISYSIILWLQKLVSKTTLK